MSEAVIETQSLTLSYVGGAPVVQGLNLKIERGEFIALLGPSGCGKTTLLRYLAGLFREDEILSSGHATVLNVAPCSRQHLRGGDVGFVFETPSLLPWCDVAANARLGLDVAGDLGSDGDAAVADLIAAVGLAKSLQLYPNEMSLGMQQRVALVRCLAYDPKVVFLDSPFSSVDSQTKLQLLGLVSRLMVGEKTILFVTHDVTEAVALADRVITLTGGPAQIKSIIEVPDARPRDIKASRVSKKFAQIERDVWSVVLSNDEE